MIDDGTKVSGLKATVQAFCDVRGWTGDAKSIAMSVAIEAAELMEIFQWCSTDEANTIVHDTGRFTHMKEEMSDVLVYLLRLYNMFDIDICEALEDKLEKNAIRYPARQA